MKTKFTIIFALALALFACDINEQWCAESLQVKIQLSYATFDPNYKFDSILYKNISIKYKKIEVVDEQKDFDTLKGVNIYQYKNEDKNYYSNWSKLEFPLTSTSDSTLLKLTDLNDNVTILKINYDKKLEPCNTRKENFTHNIRNVRFSLPVNYVKTTYGNVETNNYSNSMPTVLYSATIIDTLRK